MNKKQNKDWEKIYMCSTCGVSLTNRADWCDLGCGDDYNEMIEIKRLPELIRQTLTNETKREKLELVERVGVVGFIDERKLTKRVGCERNDEYFVIGYNMAVSELNQKLDQIKKEIEGKGNEKGR